LRSYFMCYACGLCLRFSFSFRFVSFYFILVLVLAFMVQLLRVELWPCGILKGFLIEYSKVTLS